MFHHKLVLYTTILINLCKCSRGRKEKVFVILSFLPQNAEKAKLNIKSFKDFVNKLKLSIFLLVSFSLTFSTAISCHFFSRYYNNALKIHLTGLISISLPRKNRQECKNNISKSQLKPNVMIFISFLSLLLPEVEAKRFRQFKVLFI
jgi:hypothetical protein